MKKIGLYIAVLFLVSSCGWQPLYNSQTMAIDNLNTVWIDVVNGVDGVTFRNALMDLFYIEGEPKQPLYVLKTGISSRSRSLGIKKDDTATRAQINFQAKYTLLDRETLRTLHTGTVSTITGYNILDNQYSTTISRDNAYKTGLRNLAEKMRLNLSLYFDNLQR